MSVVFTEYGPYRPLSDRLPAFLETYPPSQGYGIEIEVSDLLAIKPGLRILYEAAIKADKSFVQAYLERGDVWVVKGNDREALAEYEQALKIQPQFATAYERIGMLHQRNKNWAEAERAYLAVTRIASQSPVAYNNLAWVKLAQKGGEQEALRWATKAAGLAPQSGQIQDTLGWVYRAVGDKAKALEILQHAITLEPKNPEILYHLGIAQAEFGQKKEGMASLRHALELKKDFAGADEARAQLAALEK